MKYTDCDGTGVQEAASSSNESSLSLVLSVTVWTWCVLELSGATGSGVDLWWNDAFDVTGSVDLTRLLGVDLGR